MELKYLQTFRTVVEEGSFSRAAQKLNYTQSTITFQIGQLERELSASLFEKIGRKMTLTKAGEQLLPYVDDVLQSVQRLRGFEGDLLHLQGDVHIGMAETLMCYRLAPVIGEFQRRAPGTRIFLRTMNCYDIRDALLDGTLDLGVFYEDVGGFGTGLAAHPLGRFEILLLAAPETARRFPDFHTPDRLLPLPFVINEPNCIFRQMFERYLRERAIRLDHTIELCNILAIKNLVKSGVGVTCLPRFAAQEELERGELAVIPTDMAAPYITAVCAHHRNKWISPAMQLLEEMITGAGAE